MVRSACLCVALLMPVESAAQFRPLSLGKIVDAVGSNPEGMPTEELRERVTTYAYYTSDDLGVGLAVRFARDPDGAILVGWRSGKELWRYEWIEEPGLGRLESLRPAGPGFIIETRHADGTGTTVVLRQDLTVFGTVPGIVRLPLPSGALVLQRARDLVLFDQAANQTATIFTAAEAASPAFSAFKHDAKTDTLTFELRAGGTQTTVRCTGISGPQRKCS